MMNFKRWFIKGFLMVLTASFAASTVVLVVLREREKGYRLIAEGALSRTKEVNQQLEEKLRSHKARTARLELEFQALERTNQFTLVRLRGLEKKLSRIQRELGKERSEKQSLAEERSDLNNKLMVTLSDNKSLRGRLNKMLARSPEEVDLGQIVVSATPALEGTVLIVNDKFQFVVVDLGNREQLDVGTLLNVYRQDQFIGRVQVEKIQETVAACRILREWRLQNIQENDRVREL